MMQMCVFNMLFDEVLHACSQMLIKVVPQSRMSLQYLGHKGKTSLSPSFCLRKIDVQCHIRIFSLTHS